MSYFAKQAAFFSIRSATKGLIKSRKFCLSSMAKSRFEYVKSYEHQDVLQQNCWIVIRVDGKGFHKFCDVHNFTKPNDERGLNLMSLAALAVMQEFNEVVLAYGQSDEYSFVFRRDTKVYERRRDKLISYVASLFTSAYSFHWSYIFGNMTSLKYPPVFDSRAVLYPTDDNLRDYLSWRQADVHINNLYNTTFWNLVASGLTNVDAEKRLRGTLSSDKNEILFQDFNINYNNEPAMFRKGTILLRKKINIKDDKKVTLIIPVFEDMISDKFWTKYPEILDSSRQKATHDDEGDCMNHILVKYQIEKYSKRREGMKQNS
ncbi:probable tRNA(His) guanylyltransferase [Toxorhynchites rutilus septentrionalis]|uniref:probable tRNA(His) guanylyltransferase n=1 Tax=Toxorhynchites rutilus septentrionalis TaxID=329112 RepID=UPI002478EC4F|nr:probable tRNA(His) guanylyltransferase [Toxorhynchites rutilus septentrionalis]